MSIEIPLTQGKIAVIDDEDLEVVRGYTWYAHRSGYKVYAMTHLSRDRVLYMHRLLLNLTDISIQADHIDGDGLNNRRTNLRVCTHRENQRNKGKLACNTSGYKGVTWDAPTGKWRAQLKVEGKNKYLGIFSGKEEAYAAYCKAAKDLHEEFANYG